MPAVFSDNLPFFIILIIIVILIVWNAVLQLQFYNFRKKLKNFFAGKKGSDLEDVLCEIIKRQKLSENDIKKLFIKSDFLEKISQISVQKVGLVRFNPFKDTGGDQSFSIALLDYHDSGLVISTLYTRSGTRVYSKPIKEAKSSYPLTKEEEMAIEQAKNNEK